MKLEDANKIMGEFNKLSDDIRIKKDEFDKKRLHSKDAGLVFEGLRYAWIQICECQSRLDELLTAE